MKKECIIILILLLLASIAFSQNLSQTVRGTIIDIDSEAPLIGASVSIIGGESMIGTSTDVNGKFRLENVPVGRINLTLNYLGYEPQTIPNIEVNSGKEVVLKLSMEESTVSLNEVVVTVNKNKGEALNEMSLISSQSISAETTERFAGGFSDPSRIVSAYAGVANSNDGDNDIIVRGNSPKYIQYRLEGVDIANPTHFGDQNSVKGGISALNNNLLSTSDFHTGAFTAEFGDVLSGVYDLKLRNGNNEKFEATFGFGLLGTDFTFEGPLKKGGGSYLVNYRYSTISLISDLGLVDVDGNFNFQDAAFKIVLPTKKVGTFSLFGLGGKSNFAVKDVKPDLQVTPGDPVSGSDINEDYNKDVGLLTVGLNHSLSLNSKSYLKSSISVSGNGFDEDVFESKQVKVFDNEGLFLRDSTVSSLLDYKSRLKRTNYQASMTYHLKLNAKNKLQIGSKYSLIDFDYEQSWFDDAAESRFTALDFNENIGTLRNFISWKHRFTKDIVMVAGLHNMNVLYNQKSTLEPRLAFKWKVDKTNSISLGLGNHSKMESIHNYFAKVELPDGTIVEPNKDLGLLKANHVVLGYEKRFTKNLMAKVELYYQQLYDLPVENNDTSYYATINEDNNFRYVDLVNEGTGKNYGIELTVERFFDNNFYFLANGSLYNSKYKSLEGVERNTQYNGNYLANFLVGKEFTKLGKKDNQTLSLNGKVFFGGAKKLVPFLRDEQGNVNGENGNIYNFNEAYNHELEDVYLIILSASYKFDRPKATHEIFINLDNITNTKGNLSEYYDADEPGGVGTVQQFGFFPNLMYRVHF